MTLNLGSLLSMFCGSTVPTTHISLGPYLFLKRVNSLHLQFMTSDFKWVVNAPKQSYHIYSSFPVLQGHVTSLSTRLPYNPPNCYPGVSACMEKSEATNLLNYLPFIKQIYWQQWYGNWTFKNETSYSLEIKVDLYAVVRNNTERTQVHFAGFSSTVTLRKTIVYNKH